MIAYIPARSKSKRIRDKNIYRIDGTPLIIHTINKLKQLKFIKHICVSTDSLKYKKIVEKAGAKVLNLRSKKLSDDISGFMDLIKYDLERFCVEFNDNDVLFNLATSCLVNKRSYNEACKNFNKKKPNIIMSVGRYEYPPYFAMKIKKNDTKLIFPNQATKNTQEMPDLFFDAGCFYIFNRNKIKQYSEIKKIKKTYPFKLNYLEYADIDDNQDLNIFKLKYNAQKN